MKNYLEQWSNQFASRLSATVARSGRVEGVRDKVLGPRSDYASIVVAFEASDSLKVECSADNRAELEACGYLDYAVFGLLDVLMTASTYPMRNIRLNIVEAEIHPIHANQLAFRWAGRDAGRKIIEMLSANQR
ncbi:hypothetical protein DB346_11260 [Verrucomicrobia bacterium LW23]|nr:hypothetical protein DB346_11260 [Verrucomicrobia bacterium LW23]